MRRERKGDGVCARQINARVGTGQACSIQLDEFEVEVRKPAIKLADDSKSWVPLSWTPNQVTYRLDLHLFRYRQPMFSFEQRPAEIVANCECMLGEQIMLGKYSSVIKAVVAPPSTDMNASHVTLPIAARFRLGAHRQNRYFGITAKHKGFCS
nr:hypothetical protein CFP56_11466 [Quercus suber]